MTTPRPLLLASFFALCLLWSGPAQAQQAPTASTRPDTLPRVVELFEAQRDQVISVQTEHAPPMRGLFGSPGGPLRGQGSGFIVDPGGLAITNWHVVAGARSIQVTLADRSSYPARLIGADPSTDIALIEIDSPRQLQPVRFGTVSTMKPGQWVIAIGSPFGLEHSVTVGVLSAMGRQIGVGPYDDFLQTDASINPGNSGGPLYNLAGEVIGVNTAIIRDARGIGFSVPIDTVVEILPQLRENGFVVRGYIGTGVQELSPDLAETFGVRPRQGVLLRTVESGGPASQAGLRPGDIVLSIGDEATHEPADLLTAVANHRPQERVQIRYLRDGRTLTTQITIAERPDPRRREIQQTREAARAFEPGRLGVSLRALSSTLAAHAGVPPGVGVFVDRVEIGSPASGVLQQGDVVLQIAGVEVNDPTQVPGLLREFAGPRPIRMLIIRQGDPYFVAVRIPAS